jgi:hypothetical protein
MPQVFWTTLVPPHPVQVQAPSLRSPLFVVPHPPAFVARAAAANINPHTRLSHMTPFTICDWCTRERCRLIYIQFILIRLSEFKNLDY